MSKIRARVNLKVGKNSDIPAELVTFSMFSEGSEHIALVFKGADSTKSPIVRVHSECLTGDVFHSSRCDCGEQLDETIELMANKGGIILYLRQEGRGIGLYNKIDAYVLQSQGVDTYSANRQLGFKDDERNFDDAIKMLQVLNVEAIKLVTNNPKKIAEIGRTINIVETISTSHHQKGDNEHYLHIKAQDGGHKFGGKNE